MTSVPRPTPVNAPQLIQVSTDAEGRPRKVQLRSRQWAVHEVCDQWVQPPEPPDSPRGYYVLRLTDGQLWCVFRSAGPAQ
jgi:hypothetical protein